MKITSLPDTPLFVLNPNGRTNDRFLEDCIYPPECERLL